VGDCFADVDDCLLFPAQTRYLNQQVVVALFFTSLIRPRDGDRTGLHGHGAVAVVRSNRGQHGHAHVLMSVIAPGPAYIIRCFGGR
jgi:hypothetical protein